MTEDINPRATLGDNRPPPFDADQISELDQKVRDFTDAAGEWADLKKIETEEQAGKLVDLLSGARGLYKKIDDARKDAKKPHDDAAKAVQAAFKPLLDKMERVAKVAKSLQAAWLTEKEAEERRERERLAREAEERRIEAERLAREAESRNDIDGQVEAEAAAKAAEEMARAAQREVSTSAKSASGGGRTVALRTVREAEIANIRHLFMHFQNHPDVVDVLRRLANAEIRAAKGAPIEIPGITIIERKVAA